MPTIYLFVINRLYAYIIFDIHYNYTWVSINFDFIRKKLNIKFYVLLLESKSILDLIAFFYLLILQNILLILLSVCKFILYPIII